MKDDKKPHGGHRWSLPPEKRRVRINVTLSPETIRLLEPFTRTGERGQMIDRAVQEYLQKAEAPA